MQISTRTTISAVCMTLFLVSCTCDGVPKGFFLMPAAQQETEFEKYDFGTQYKIYICGSQKVEPSMLHLVSPFAREGRRIVPALEAKLESADKDLTIRDIVYVFREMNDLGAYDVAGDKSLMNKLRDKVSAIKDPAWRIVTENDLLAIREKSPKQ